MIKLYTYGYIDDYSKFINEHDSVFSSVVLNDELDQRDKEIIKEIDDAECINKNNIVGKFGYVTSIKNISMGAKIVLNVRWMIKNNKLDKPVDITSCGDNALSVLIKEIGDKDITLGTCNYSTFCNDKTNIIVNDKYKIERLSDIRTIEEGV